MSVFDKKGNYIGPEGLIALGRCPETGVDLEDLDIETHIAQLWPRDRSPEALHRIDLLRQYAKQRSTPKSATSEVGPGSAL